MTSFYSEEYFRGDVGYRDYAATEKMKRRTFQDRLNRIAAELEGRGRLLDVGCATGTLVLEALEQGWDAHGIDISEYAVSFGRTHAATELGTRLRAEVIQTCSHPKGSLDVVILSDMIEHVHEPVEVIRAAHSLLRRNGILFVETPNLAGLMARFMRSRWPMYRPPEHLVYFSPRSLGALLGREGFSPCSFKPSMKALTWNYVIDKLGVNQAAWGRLRGLGGSLGDTPFWVPAGSFWMIARRTGQAGPSEE